MDLELIPIYLITSIPFFLIVYLLLKLYNSHQLKQKKLSQGIGRGVAGFQTGVRRVAVPQEILDRIRRGEEVSAEEITRAQEKMATKSRDQSSAGSDDDANRKSKTKPTSKIFRIPATSVVEALWSFYYCQIAWGSHCFLLGFNGIYRKITEMQRLSVFERVEQLVENMRVDSTPLNGAWKSKGS
ncbi:uncharacterized protein MELLADRAFT_110697 [Melampsora larici-populina 98AG31]|uniref:Uncharacterized protein n=1 Tax=Melampsora larici-populina (strain 98AG31 / pathotype 3-4-7) TaxID=747676 RepID=F4S0N3_MELLP|nr:uncharacterized protein MELLADRAFT_110697 [Melampsora larici-populina 98AG31]EGG01836.1 hypothetical protein MELLADRAFT_110697 [Melampsora larici-populina 98AG31]